MKSYVGLEAESAKGSNATYNNNGKTGRNLRTLSNCTIRLLGSGGVFRKGTSDTLLSVQRLPLLYSSLALLCYVPHQAGGSDT